MSNKYIISREYDVCSALRASSDTVEIAERYNVPKAVVERLARLKNDKSIYCYPKDSIKQKLFWDEVLNEY